MSGCGGRSPTGRRPHRAGADGEPAWLPDGRIVYTEFSGASSALRWLDPANPDIVHEIPVGIGDPRRPSGILP